MKVITAGDNKRIVLTKKEWEAIGTKAGWLRVLAKKGKKKAKPANETPYNPWAVCTESIGDTEGTTERSKWSEDAKDRYERCVKKVKKKNLKQ